MLRYCCNSPVKIGKLQYNFKRKRERNGCLKFNNFYADCLPISYLKFNNVSAKVIKSVIRIKYSAKYLPQKIKIRKKP